MKRKILILLAVLIVMFAVPVIANAASVDDLTFDAATGTITACNKNATGELVIPAEIGGVKVTSIGDEAFQVYRCGYKQSRFPVCVHRQLPVRHEQ